MRHLHRLDPAETELDAAARLADEARARGFFPPVVLVAGEEDTALATPRGVEVVTRTPELPELDIDGLARPAIAEL